MLKNEIGLKDVEISTSFSFGTALAIVKDRNINSRRSDNEIWSSERY